MERVPKQKQSGWVDARRLNLTALLAGLALLGGCKQAPPPAAMPPPEITVAKPVAKKIVEHAEYTGRMAAIQNVSVRPRVSGYIMQIPFKEGSIVKKDNLLFVIDPRPYQAALEQAQGQVKQAQAQKELNDRNFTRAQELQKTNVSSKEEFDTGGERAQPIRRRRGDRAGRLRRRQTQPGVLPRCSRPSTGG